MDKLFVLLFATTVLWGQTLCQTGPMVTIPGLGTVEGDFDNSYVNDRPYYRFRGMPFAAPPVGSYRFKAPGPLEPWSGVYNATAQGQRCPQIITNTNATDEVEGRATDNEDCLYLSVYTPQVGAGVNLPVILFYHGGGFVYGSGIIYDGKKFMDQDVVLVTPHYRLGPLGFLSLETDDIPGNAGMIDQVRALEWVRAYISVFGGDPNQITVMGESAGAASSSMLNISPLSTGLFKQYISQSGSSTAVWAIDRNPVRSATEMGKIMNCTALDIATLTTCFQTADVMTLLEANDVLYKNELKEGRYTVSAPTIQKAGAVRFLERDPKDILDEGSYVHKPALLGANKNEGTLVYSLVHNGFLVPNGLHNDTEYLQREFTNFMLEFFAIQDQGETLASGIEKAFFGQQNMGNVTAMAGGIVDYGGDMMLKAPVYNIALYNSQVAPTYLYAFRFLGDVSLWPYYGSPALIPGGVCHANELLLQFDIPALILRERDRLMSKKIIQLWYNFAKYGDPNPAANPVADVPAWPLFDGTVDGSYMRLDDNCTIMQHYSNNEFFASVDEGFPWY